MPLPPVDPEVVSHLRKLGPDGPGTDSDDSATVGVTAAWVRGALTDGLLSLPRPGSGRTLERWAALRPLGSVDLDLARLAEAHADAEAILADLDADLHTERVLPVGDGPRLWGVWAANPPTGPLTAVPQPGGKWCLEGTKPWCSGAGCCDAALVTALADDGYRLFAVDLHHPRVTPVEGSWPARSMRGSDSRSVRFAGVPASPLGAAGAYLERPGFWHGAVGVAAVWLGGATGVAVPLWTAHARRPLHAHALAHAGAVDAVLAGAEALLGDS